MMQVEHDKEKLIEDLKGLDNEKLYKLYDPVAGPTSTFDKLIDNICRKSDGSIPVDFQKRKRYLEEIFACGVFLDKVPELPKFLLEKPREMKMFMEIIKATREYYLKKMLTKKKE